jgi:hypothetical protein
MSLRRLFILCCVMLLPACVAVWGKGYNVIMKNSEGITIEYDPWVTQPKTVADIATREAAVYGKIPVPVDCEDSPYHAIEQRRFKFVKP